MALFKLNAQVKIGDTFPAVTDITDYIISIRRDYSICDFTQRYILEVDPILWRNLVKAGVPLTPGTHLEIYEYGAKVLTGFVNRITRARKPNDIDTIEGQDTYKLAMDFFNDNETETAHGETIAYWSEELLGRCGLNFILDNEKVGLRTVPIGTEFGFRTIHECLVTLAAYAAGYYYVDSGGNVRLSKGRAPYVPDITIKGGTVPNGEYAILPTAYYSGANYGSIFAGYSITDDILTRNRAIIWGWKGPDHILVSGEDPFIKADLISDNISLPVTRTILYASPAIQDENTAWTLARDILNQLSNFTDIVAWDVQGSPDFRVGGRIYHNNNFNISGAVGAPYVRLATTVNSQMDKDGYTAHIRVGERCPRFAGWTSQSALNRAVWIAGAAGGPGMSDPIPEKLIWTGDLGMGGEPTFNLVTNIPEGNIYGMEVCRDNSAIFLVMRTDTPDAGDLITVYWADAQDVMDGIATWTEICKSSTDNSPWSHDGTEVTPGWFIETENFNVAPINSIHCVGKTLYIGARIRNLAGTLTRHAYGEWKNGVTTWYGPVLTNGDLGSVVTKDHILDRVDSNTTRFYNPKTASENFRYDEFAGFNGVSSLNGLYPLYETARLCAGFFVNELNDGNFTFVHTHALNTGIDLRQNETVLLLNQSNAIINAERPIRGNYYGNQLQFVTHDGFGNGDLYVAADGANFSTNLSWAHGICICISDLDPKMLYWMGTWRDVGEEIGRFSYDGGQTFVLNLGTGNWWGTNEEVLAGTKMQSSGIWYLKNIHPTFEVSIT